MKLKDYLHYYIYSGVGVYVFPDETITNGFLAKYKEDYPDGVYNPLLTLENYAKFLNDGYKPILRPLEDMTEEEMVNLLTDLFPFDMEDKPTADEFSMEMFYNDDGLMVDGDVSVGANYTCRCYEGQIAIKQCGTICFFDEAGNQEHGINVPKAYHYLLSKHFDLFGLIDAGLAIDAKTLNP